MNIKNTAISSGIVLLLLVAGALIWSQTKQSNNPSGQITLNIAENPQTEVSPSPIQITSPTVTVKDQIELTVSQPANGINVTSPSILVKGNTAPNAEVSINDKDTTADTYGNFTANINLDEGENSIFVTASDNEGNFAEKELSVNYNVSE